MQDVIKKIAYIALFIYTALAVTIPEKIYVDRFLLDMPFINWIPYQLFPSMYSTEIIISSTTDSTEFSKVHHPMRIFYDKVHLECDTFSIAVTYREFTKIKTVALCNNRLSTVSISENTSNTKK